MLRILFIIAILLRLAALALPSFSTDTQRFLGDGLNVAAGKNPYAVSSTVPMEYSHLRSFYPPLQEIAFGIAVKLYPSPLVFRVIGGVAELIFLCWFFYRKRKKKNPLWISLFLLFNPVSLHEIWREGHLDHIGVFFLYFAMVNAHAAFAYRRSMWRTYLFTLLGIAWKFVGIFALVFRLRRGGISPLRNTMHRVFSFFTVASVIFFILQFLPSLIFTPFAEQGLTVYTNYWHHGNGVILALQSLGFGASHGVYLVQRLIIIIAALVAIFYLKRRIALHDAIWFSLGSLLVLFPVQHPWYYFLLFPAILLSRRWRVLMAVLCCLTPLTYFGYSERYKALGFFIILAVWSIGCIIHFTRHKNYRLRWVAHA